MKPTTSSRKVLVPLATLLAAGAIAVGSGASFTATTSNTLSSVTTGHLTQTNSKSGAAIFSLEHMKPGDTVTGTVTLTSTGDIPQVITLKELPGYQDGFSAGALTLSVTDVADPTNPVYSGSLAGLAAAGSLPLNSGAAWKSGDSHTYKFSASLDLNKTVDADQGKSASAAFEWDGVQTPGTTTNQ